MPRLAYTLNEMLSPSRSQIASNTGFSALPKICSGTEFVRASQVLHMPTRFSPPSFGVFPQAAQTSNPGQSGELESNSRRPVCGFISFCTSYDTLYVSISGIYTPLHACHT